ncbi:hypothetical protein BD410DRAFT_809206 [Rickenella mellea]|uniref:Uncharacterized protein n=1 Tax=Rickenella mellea TaxID=50990 RepID=A0A4Y7PJU0_9AGAM|nr:hypothetical protein BD410DRAFT_809206 [Rickenella mellea]
MEGQGRSPAGTRCFFKAESFKMRLAMSMKKLPGEREAATLRLTPGYDAPAPDRVAHRKRPWSLYSHGGNGQADVKAISGDAPSVSVDPKASSAEPVMGSALAEVVALLADHDWGMFSTSGFGETLCASLAAATLVDKKKGLKENGAATPVSRRVSRKPKTMPEHARRMLGVTLRMAVLFLPLAGPFLLTANPRASRDASNVPQLRSETLAQPRGVPGDGDR